ncbi:transcriptional regulator [Pedobacter sp. HMWF019]|uniref:helix-turn-helix domain-containing protein n=1 Tax=Pedobacter sp. HMWF019 TaxID=2056856 RepID=UPI000D359C12|nr:helix-turn-helix transcriptional regulator [Pedobacter sp. HMWF019]PTT02672.1 transcriptional regulator [Pedobacter sp. HMWF019]
MESIGKNIKHLRRKVGWSQKYIADKLKISSPGFSKIESGITDVNISRLMQLANLFEVSFMDLLYGEPKGGRSKEEVMVAELKDKLNKKDDEIVGIQAKIIQLYEILHSDPSKTK